MYTYQPKRTYLTKNLISVVLLFVVVWVSTWVPMYFIMKDEGPVNYLQASLFWSTIGNLVWALPLFFAQWPIFKRYCYELLDDEIVVHSGWVVQKVRHVPYRMVTNIEIRRGLIDRWLGIGNLSIDTAGNSDPNARPEAQLLGLADIETVYDEVAACLRAFDEAQQRQPWERTRRPVTEAVDSDEDVLQAILGELKTINAKLKA
ncbi:MAG: PH domain-containing protein [Anaerolineae bacterium]|jgi:membrane protein YdbS with pleckstrin-like domain|nr:PH domain-containing protein [Anaerolineae bacterium]